MPETHWTVRWPDGSEERLYSPSSVVAELFTPGQIYPLADFALRARIAMERASGRVQRKYGHPCSAAIAQLGRIEARVATFEAQPAAEVACLSISQ